VKRIEIGPLYYEISRHNPPRLTIEPGETVVVETEDAFTGQIREESDRRDVIAMPYGNPQTGPILVEGAEKGDTLTVHIHDIEARLGQAATRTGGTSGLGEWLGLEVPHGTRICPVRDGMVWWSENVGIPYAPMIGTIGTAPDMGVPTTGPAGPHGGNMDIKETTIGNTVYLPVFIPGALLHLGDVHAAQGDGELCTTALEMPATVTITVDLIKGRKLERPRIRSPKELMAVETGLPMEQSVRRAYADLILWMEEEYGIPRWDGFNLVTQVGEISVGYVNIGTVAAKIALEYVESAATDFK
jgi:acetamidase/formamidase